MDLLARYLQAIGQYLPAETKDDVLAELRANHGVKALDALHLSIAATSGVDLFLTHDRRLHKLVVPGLPFIAGLETDLF